MKTPIQKIMLVFLRDYLTWVGMGVPDENQWDFDPRYGLCGNLCQYPLTGDSSVYLLADEALEDMLIESTGCWEYPFDTSEEFYLAVKEQTHHLNEKRLTWVRQTIDKLEKLG